MKYSSNTLVLAIITGICLVSSACRKKNIQTKVFNSDIIDNHASTLPKEIETPTYSFNTSSTNVESWKEIIKSENIKGNPFIESLTENEKLERETFTHTARQAEQVTKKIYIQVIDDKGKLVERAIVKFISEHKKDKTKSKIKPLLSSTTDAKGCALVPYQGKLKAIGKESSRKVLWIKGYFLVTTVEFKNYKIPYRTLHFPEAKSSKAFPLKLNLKKPIKIAE